LHSNFRFLPLLHLLQRPRPIFFEQARQRAVGQKLSAGLTAGAVIGFVLGVDDTLADAALQRFYICDDVRKLRHKSDLHRGKPREKQGNNRSGKHAHGRVARQHGYADGDRERDQAPRRRGHLKASAR
jgi:hypothetical protein